MMQTNLAGPVAEALARFMPETLAGPLAALVVFVGVLVVAHLLTRGVVLPLLDRVLTERDLDAHARQPLLKLARVLVAVAAITAAFGFAGFPNFLQSMATIAAAATLAIGFAMQDVIRNFVAGVFIYADRPFRIGDWIEWDDNSGVVEDISLRVTRVRTFDNELLTVPNATLTDDVVKNPVEADRLRVKAVFGIGYDDDIDRATDIILEEATGHDEILADPAPSVRLVELGDSSVGLQARVWIADPSRSDFVKTRATYVQAVKERFDAEGITIPYPNRTLGGQLAVAPEDGALDGTTDTG